MLYVCLPSVFLTEMRWALRLLLYLLPLEQCLGQQRRSVKAFITFLLRHLCRKPSGGHTWGEGTMVGFFPVPGSQCPIYTGSVLWESPWPKDGPFRCHFFENGSSFGAVCPRPAQVNGSPSPHSGGPGCSLPWIWSVPWCLQCTGLSGGFLRAPWVSGGGQEWTTTPPKYDLIL